MYRSIMVPVDLAHLDTIEKALQTAADLARHYKASVRYVGVSPEAPGSVARTPEEYAEKLDAFARKQAEAHGIETSARAIATGDPAAELNDELLRAAKADETDLIVIGSHSPGFADWLWPSHGGAVAAHAKASVFVVR